MHKVKTLALKREDFINENKKKSYKNLFLARLMLYQYTVMILRDIKKYFFSICFLFVSMPFGVHAGVRYDGIEITVGVQNVSAIGSPALAHARTWEQQTGGKVRVVQSPFNDLFDLYRQSLISPQPTYDVLLYASAWVGDFHPYLMELPSNLLDSDLFDDIHPTYRERLMSWDGKWIALTIDGDLFSGYYRKDLFEDPSNQAEFRARYARPLVAPETWQEYRDIAEFFTGRQDREGQPLWGTAEAFAYGGQQVWTVFSRVSPYVNHRGHLTSQFFDKDTMRAQVNNPAWQRAVEEYREILRFSPPDALNYGIVEARDAFIGGHTAMILDWGDTAQLAANPATSQITGKVGYFVLPGSKTIWHDENWQWQTLERPNKAPFLAFGGWVASVPANSRHPEAAWDYLMWYTNLENSQRDVVTAGSGINPYRLSHFSNIDAWTQAFSQVGAAEYLNVLRTSLDAPHAALDLRIPGAFRYGEALEYEVTCALRGERSVRQALDRAAARWEAITDELGRAQQLAIYRTSMGLPSEPQLPAPPSAQKSIFTIGFSQATTTEPWRLLFNKELREEAAHHPEVVLRVADGQDDAAKQSADVAAFIRDGVDAILISPKVADLLTPVVSQAFNAGIPVFVLDRDVANDRYVQFIGGNNRDIGRAAGRYAVRLLGGAGKASGKIVEIWGGMASTPAADRHQGFIDVVGKEDGLVILNTPQDGDWKQDLAYEIMVQALEKHPRIDLVYAHNDPMAFGAHLAAKEAGRSAEIHFLGIDGIPAEGVKWVHDGILSATFLYKTPGSEGIRQALKFLKGEKIDKRVTLPTLVIDQQNASMILQRNGLLPP
jgi:multiple sugar transport system substrate-binding protein